jgi:hypothetical protein
MMKMTDTQLQKIVGLILEDISETTDTCVNDYSAWGTYIFVKALVEAAELLQAMEITPDMLKPKKAD